MTISSGFFNSVNHDRLYDAEQLSSIFDGIIIDGVYENYGEAFMVTANSEANSSVIIGTGRAWFDHTWTVNDSQFAMQLDPPNELLGRTDAIVLDIDRTQNVRKNSILYLKGNESSPEFPPVLVNESRHKQYPIAYITRHAEVNSPIKQDDIKITVGTSDCPIVTGILESQNLENLMAQLDSEFNTWWEGIKAILDENVATNLQNQINEIKEQLNSDDALVGLLTKPVYELFKSGSYGINASSTNISFTHNPPDTYDNRSGDPLRRPYPTCALLPDGKVLTAYCYDEGAAASPRAEPGTGIVLTTPEGVSTVTYINDYHAKAPNQLNYGFMCNFMGGKFTSYPVSIRMLHWGDRSDGYGWLITVNISSTRTIQYNEERVFQVPSSPPLVYGRSTKMETPTTSGTYLGTFWKENSKTVKFATVNSSGVLGTIISSMPISNADKYGGMDDVVLGQNGYWIYKLSGDGSRYIKIDESDLSTELVSSAPPSEQYEILYEAETNNLSETNGFTSLKANIRGSLAGESEKISDYFVGASNAGNAIPEGTFIANNRDSYYVGIGPNGENIAIGSNGGAAILKKTSSVPSISFNKIVTYLPGMLDVGNTKYYLLYKDNGTTNPATLIRIGD